uniref:Uncharacterized protein n=1 Tax=Setaria digitata TaxID=48799 RepID=A0A915Q3B3_9BILA
MMKSNEADAVIALATPAMSGNVGCDDCCDTSLLVRSMYAASSGSFATEQGRERRSRPKPPPPLKPAALRNKIACKGIQNPDSLAGVKANVPVAETSSRSSPSNTIDSSGTVASGEGNYSRRKTLFSNDATEEPNLALEEMRITELQIEDVKRIENESLTLETSQRSSIKTAMTSKRASFINEEIKKPKMKPPPPPTQSPTPSSQSGRDSSTVETTKKKPSLKGASGADRNVGQSAVDSENNMPSKFHRFERKPPNSECIPSVPSIPPPSPPVLLPQDSVNDEMYEEIEQPTHVEENGGIDGTKTADEQINMQDANSDRSEQDECYADKEGKVLNGLNDTGNTGCNYFGAKLRMANEGKYYVKNKKNNAAAREKAMMLRRPKSALEFDRLLRIKSDIQLNITKKVGQIKFKVSSASLEKPRCKRLSSIFYTDREKLKDHSDDKVLAKIDFPLDEQCIYGDVWSSDEDDFTSTIERNSFNGEQVKNQSYEAIDFGKDTSDEPCSMLSEIERELRLRFHTHDNLPDIVLESKRRSMSADPLPSDTTSITAKLDDASRSSCRNIKASNEGNNYGACCQTKSGKLRLAAGYETVISSAVPSPDHNCLPSTSSDYTLKEIDRSIYTARIIPDPQPLYQIYMMEQNKQLIYETDEQEINQGNFSGKSISKIQRTASIASTDSGRGADCSTTLSQFTSSTSMRRDRLVAGSHFASQRSLWCELPEVRNAGLLERLDEDTKKLQEAYFEVITSEASYLRSVNILITHFMAAPEMLGSKRPSSVITNEERKQLFSNIFAVRDCSERPGSLLIFDSLLSDLENRLQENLVLSDVCDILCDHFEANFDPYVKYCSNQIYQDRTLRKLKSENPSFLSCIQRLEGDRLCQGLDMRSFLMLPMQRVTRYPLLVIAILDYTQQDSTNYQTAQIALHLANYVVRCCNEGARHMERTEQLLEIERRLVYKSSDLRRIPLVSSGRYLVKRGPLICLNEKRAKKLLHTRQQFQSIYIFLFSDIIMLTKKKVNGTYVCKDYSARRFVDIEPIEIDDPKLLQSISAHIPLKKPHLFICTLMHNAVGKQVELLLNADSETDRERWLSALRPPTCTNPEEKIYADWDCPQAIAVHQYFPGQEDELTLEKGDLINILRKMPDGWFYGERIRDGYSGWFPSSYVQQVLNDHVRAKNYRQRLRVIQAAADFRFHQRQMKIGTDENTLHLMERFRRLSNTKTMLGSSSSS